MSSNRSAVEREQGPDSRCVSHHAVFLCCSVSYVVSQRKCSGSVIELFVQMFRF
ncbi:hypothetical protein RB6504 [Rhodopirellula baltica SH 1]|uniref:Uncharacterized protein n=1 Tax=Rhodopirellula baltica (strain DSM 10527 / NCIMB 13988 / SH1) TaxID=243090 RepID=Q7UQ57_RHOBA|nr:hypothetical protein RB6504 [Rhodopirellula baltica SH 1]